MGDEHRADRRGDRFCGYGRYQSASFLRRAGCRCHRRPDVYARDECHRHGDGYLGRPLDTQGQAFWVDQFVNKGAQNETVVGGFLGALEFYNSPTRGQMNRALWVESAIDEVFHRAAAASDLSFWETLMQ